MNNTLKTMLGVAGLIVATQAAAQVTFYEREGFRGRSFDADRPIANFERFGFNDRAASAVVQDGAWEVCEDARFSGRCVVLQPGRYESLSRMGLNYQVSSVRPANTHTSSNDRQRYAVAGDQERWHRHNDERLYTADVTSVRAIMGQAEQRCWVEQQQVVQNDRGGPNVGGAIIGGVLGGILGHQIGNGRGNDVATAAGAIGGAAVGSNVGRGDEGNVVTSRDVQRCASVPHDRPDYYDVTYFFRGQEHHVQMSTPPGRSITVNQDGEPRV